MFLRGQWEPRQGLQQFAREARNIDDLGTLAYSLANLVSKGMEAKWVVLLELRSSNCFSATVSLGTPELQKLSIAADDPLLQRIAKEDRPLEASEAQLLPEWRYTTLEVRDNLIQGCARIFVPLKTRDDLTGLLVLGPKSFGRSYGQEELDLLQTVAWQAATTMENAHLHGALRAQLRELEETQAQLVQSARLASVGTLAAGVAHEINNPVFSIQGRSELLLGNADLHLKSEKAREYVRVINEMAERVAKVVQGILVFSRREEPPQSVNLNDIVESTLQLVEHDLRLANIRVEREYAEELPAINGVDNQLQQVVMNLVLNGRDAMSQGGTLTLSTGIKEGQVTLACADTGTGMPHDHLERIFDAFYTTKESGKGTGLGLYITHKIVQDHGGSIEVWSQPGAGAVFTLCFPIACSVEGHGPRISANEREAVGAMR